jgi:hypothetical protein
MTTQESQESLKKKFTTSRSSFLHLLPAQHASLGIVQNYCNLGKTFSSRTGSCLHIGIMFSWMHFCNLNCLELFSWWFWNINLHHFVPKTAATLFWETYEKKLWFFFYSSLSCLDLHNVLILDSCMTLVFLSESLATEYTGDDRHQSSSSETCLLIAIHHILHPCAALFCSIIWEHHSMSTLSSKMACRLHFTSMCKMGSVT